MPRNRDYSTFKNQLSKTRDKLLRLFCVVGDLAFFGSHGVLLRRARKDATHLTSETRVPVERRRVFMLSVRFDCPKYGLIANFCVTEYVTDWAWPVSIDRNTLSEGCLGRTHAARQLNGTEVAQMLCDSG